MPSPGGRIRDMQNLLEYYRKTGKMNWEFRSAGRKLGNLPIQAMSAEIKMAAIDRCQKNQQLARLKALMRIEIHDELHWSCPPKNCQEADAICKKDMEEAYPIYGLTTSGGYGSNWVEAK